MPVHRYEGMANRPNYNAGRKDFVFHGPADRIPEDVAPPLARRSFDLVADVTVSVGETDGTLLALGGRFGGLSWYVKEGRPTFRYNMMGGQQTSVASTVPLAPGDHKLGVLFARAAGQLASASVVLTIDGAAVAQGEIPHTVDNRFSLDESFDIGSDRGTPVAPDEYAASNLFSGDLHRMEVNVK